MNPKIELKLLEIISRFEGLTLVSTQLKEKKVQDKDLLTLELIFSDRGAWKTMVLVLNRDLTIGDYQDLYEEIIK